MVFPVEHSGLALASHHSCTTPEMHKWRANTQEMLESPWNKHLENPGNSLLPGRLGTVLPFLLLFSPMQCPQQPPALLMEMLWGLLSLSKPGKFSLSWMMSELPVPSSAGSQREGRRSPGRKWGGICREMLEELYFCGKMGRLGSGNVPGNAFVINDKISSACKMYFSPPKRDSFTTRVFGQRNQE